MKKIIISSLAVIAAVIPFHVSLVSAADNFFGDHSPYNNPNPIGVIPDAFFGNPGGAVQPGIDRSSDDDYFFGSRRTHDNGTQAQPTDTFFGPGSPYNNPNPIGVVNPEITNEGSVNPFAPCAYDFCLDPCEWSDCGCQWYDTCECDASCDTEAPCASDCVSDVPYGDNEHNQNSNTNINNIIIENYITGYGYGGVASDYEYSEASRRNRAPSFITTPVTEAAVGSLYRYDAAASDDTAFIPDFSLLSGPAGMTITSDGAVRWTPTASQGGLAHPVVIIASDGVYTTPQSFEVFVRSVSNHDERESVGRVAGASVVATAEASEQSTLRAFNIRVDTDELGNSVITWDTTRPTRGRVLFGRASQSDRSGTDFTGIGQYEFATPNTAETATSHRVVLGQLEVERVYYFRVVSFIGSDIIASSERSFVQLGTGNTLSGEAGFASVIGTMGSFLGSSWFLFFLIIVVVLIIVFRRRHDGEIDAHAPAHGGHGAAHH